VRKPQKSPLGNKRGNNLQNSQVVSGRPQKKIKVALRTWRALLIRKKGEVLGSVTAATLQAAEAAAIVEFKLTPEQRRRLIVHEWV
jgi:hypothetical protein